MLLKKKVTRTFFNCLTVIFLSSGFAVAQTPVTENWTLQKCIDHAKENNISLKQVQLNVLGTKVNYQQAIADLFPTINGSVGQTFNFGLQFDPTSNLLVDSRYSTTSFSASTRFIIFNGLSNYNTIAQNKLNNEAAYLDYQQAIDDVSLNIVQLYMQILFAQERLDIVRQQVEVLQQQVERSQLLFEAGVITRSDFLSIQSQLATQEITQVTGENSLASARLQLLQALYLPGMDITIDKPDFSNVRIEEFNGQETADQIYNTAIDLRPVIKSRQLKIRSAQKSLNVARGSYYPALVMNASISTIFSELRKVNPLDPNSPTVPFTDQLRQNNAQQISFGLSIPVFNGLQTRTAVQQAKISLLNSEYELLNEQFKLRNTIQQSYADAKAAYKTYESNQKNLEALEEAFNYAREKFNVQAINSVEFNDATTRYYNARTELLIAQYDYIFKTKVLDFYKGKPITF